jgi:hypothetical protein
MSEFLDWLLSEVRERLGASHAAVQEYEQLQRALAALDGVDASAGRNHGARPGNSRAAPRAPRARRTAPARSPTANRKRLGALVIDRPGVTREELQALSGLSSAAVAQNLRRMVARGELRQQELPGGQAGYATSPGQNPAAAAPANSATTANAPNGIA